MYDYRASSSFVGPKASGHMISMAVIWLGARHGFLSDYQMCFVVAQCLLVSFSVLLRVISCILVSFSVLPRHSVSFTCI